ncbi:MAG: class I SAM-dependent methyltransferase, partial [Candidatus Margulisiibacteriota bacterium]
DFRTRQFSSFVQKYLLKGKKIIEIGCGHGEYLSIMQQTGAAVYGLEKSVNLVSQCKEAGLKVAEGFMQEHNDLLKEAPFDAFFTLSYIEHLPDPNSTLRGIFANLKDDAVGLIEVPNFDMILRKNIFSEFISDHLSYFTRDSLDTMLRLNGFEIVECTDVWHAYIISAIVKKRKSLSLSHLSKFQAQIKAEIAQYISRFSERKVAVWGAGHQALTMLALMDLSDNIKYVVDSAKFKQGKYTPATHLRIVAPEMLESDPVDAVIVMAASYSDEVAKTLRQRYSNLSVVILRDYGLEII